MFVATDMCLSHQSMSFVATKEYLVWHNICHNKHLLWLTGVCHDKKLCLDKHTFVVTKDVFCHDKHVLWQKYACHDKHLVMTKWCLSRQISVVTKVLLPQKHTKIATKIVTASIHLSQQKMCFVTTNTCLSRQNFCCNKNYTCGSFRQW